MHLRKRVLVTGGSGFLGSHLCARLLEMGDEVLCVDNFFSSDRANVEEFLDNRHIDAGGALSFRVAQLNKGTWNGLRIWTYSGTYKDIDGTVKHFIDPDDAVLLARDAESVIEYGRPVDLDCAGATTYFAKQYRQDDPSGIFTVAESRPLPVTRHAGWAVRFDSVTGK